jgi:hypothetical protein
MTILNQLIKEISSKTTKGVITNLLGSLMRSEETDGSSASTSSAWNEVERKLQDLFGSDEKTKADRSTRNKQVGLAVVVLLVTAIAIYLYGRHRQADNQTDSESSEA